MFKLNRKDSIVLGALPMSLFKGIPCMIAMLMVVLASCSPDEVVKQPVSHEAQLNVQEAAPGDLVTISGAGFESGDVRVQFGGAEAKIVSITENQLVVEVPEEAVTGNVTLSVDGAFSIIEDIFNIIINRVRPTYWVELDDLGNSLIIRGTADLAGNTAKTTLYSTPNIIAALSLEPLTNKLFWVEQELNLETFEINSTIFKSNASTITTASKQLVLADPGEITSLTVNLPDDKLFWTKRISSSSGQLYQASYSGSGASVLYSGSLLSNAASLKYEEVNDNLYFIQNSRQLVLAHADSTGIAAIYTVSNPRRLKGVAFEVNSDRLFVANLGLPGDETDYIFYGNLAGTVPLDTLVSPVSGGTLPNPVENTSSLDVDRIGNFLYWLNASSVGQGDGSIYRIKLSGTATPQLIFDDINIATSVDVRGRSKEAAATTNISLQ